jgi:hypothetical protein
MAYTYYGIGTTFYGERDFRLDGTYITTEWVVLFYLPLIPMRSLRVQHLGTEPRFSFFGIGASRKFRILEKGTPNRKQVLYTYGYAALIISWSCLVGRIAISIPSHIFDSLSGVILVFVVCLLPTPLPWILRRFAKPKALREKENSEVPWTQSKTFLAVTVIGAIVLLVVGWQLILYLARL